MDYAITFTIKPHWYKLQPEEQVELAMKEINEVFHEYKKTIVIEITKCFNIHFHGIMYSKTRREFYDKLRKNKIIGFIKIKQIESWEDWCQYIMKNTPITYKDLNCIHPVPVNDYLIPFRLIVEKNPIDDAKVI